MVPSQLTLSFQDLIRYYTLVSSNDLPWDKSTMQIRYAVFYEEDSWSPVSYP
jgi:hypothetical protein